ncbi:MAG: hypothetical protein N2376_11945 [Clostridia bacterium]|nr:hypothetical protein [Clostridia bacterium]
MSQETMQKRTLSSSAKKGMSITDILLVGVLLAAGAVLKFFVGAIFTAGMKPNFIIAMYCLAIILIRPKFLEALVIGILAGVVAQFFPGTPYINLLSELIGAAAMYLLLMIPFKLELGKISIKPIISTFIATLCSGFTFLGALYALFYAGAHVKTMPVGVFLGIIFGTALVNAIIVEVLYIPLKLALGKKVADDPV